jgi:hypothetical protein
MKRILITLCLLLLKLTAFSQSGTARLLADTTVQRLLMIDLIKGDSCHSLVNECDTIFTISYVIDSTFIKLVEVKDKQIESLTKKQFYVNDNNRILKAENKNLRKQRNLFMGTSSLLLLILIII